MIRRRWLAVAVVLVAGLTAALSGCGPSAPSAKDVLSDYLTAWGKGDWTAMQRLTAGTPAGFAEGLQHTREQVLRVQGT